MAQILVALAYVNRRGRPETSSGWMAARILYSHQPSALFVAISFRLIADSSIDFNRRVDTIRRFDGVLLCRCSVMFVQKARFSAIPSLMLTISARGSFIRISRACASWKTAPSNVCVSAPVASDPARSRRRFRLQQSPRFRPKLPSEGAQPERLHARALHPQNTRHKPD